MGCIYLHYLRQSSKFIFCFGRFHRPYSTTDAFKSLNSAREQQPYRTHVGLNVNCSYFLVIFYETGVFPCPVAEVGNKHDMKGV